MEQIVKNKIKRATIKGLPVWHLTDVSEEAVSAIKDTGFWVHYRSFGLDGWYIAASDAMLPHFKAALAKKGVGFEGVEALPKIKKHGWLLIIPLHLYTIFGWFGFFLSPDMGATLLLLWFIVMVVNVILHFTGVYDGRPAYAEMLRPSTSNASSETNDNYLNSTNPGLVGTRGWHASNY